MINISCNYAPLTKGPAVQLACWILRELCPSMFLFSLIISISLNFFAGFFGVQTYQSEYNQLITIEDDGQNNTLASYFNCPNGGNEIYTFGFDQANKWSNIYLQPTLKRLQPLLKGYTLKVSDLIAMQQMCAYEVLYLPRVVGRLFIELLDSRTRILCVLRPVH